MKKYILSLLFVSLFTFCQASELAPQLGFAGGYYDAGERHSGSLAQVEYKWGDFVWWRVRPQIGFAIPEFKAFYFYGGIALELPMTEHIIFAPSFGPGIYFQGSGGRNLGYPLEFRSCIELSVESNDHRRFGIQFFHISNASLGSRNPGANALMFFIAFPI